MDLLLAIVGAALIVLILLEVFSDLFHPSRKGALSDWIGRGLFSAFKKIPRSLPLSGPLTVVVVIGTWIAILVLGFALLYFGAYPTEFRTSTNAVPPAATRWSSVVYFSFETLVTLGYGDLVPTGGFIRGISTIEALVGFALLTASVSSIVLLYPALSRMRHLARGVSHLIAAEKATGLNVADSESELVLSSLARDVTHARIDLMHFPVVYYFATNDREASTATWMPELMRLAESARSPHHPARVRLAGAALDAALHDFAAILDDRYLHTRFRDDALIFHAFARDHLLIR